MSATRRGLSKAEMNVYHRLIQGYTNAEIAAELYLSPKGVEWHCTNIYRKLGVKNRRELTKVTPIDQINALLEYVRGLEERIEALENNTP